MESAALVAGIASETATGLVELVNTLMKLREAEKKVYLELLLI